MMRRRDVISLLGGAAAPIRLQFRLPPGRRRTSPECGMAGRGRSRISRRLILNSFRAGLRELGWVEGRNLKIGTFWATGLDDMAAATQQALASDPEVVVTQEFMAIAMLLSKAPKPVVFGFQRRSGRSQARAELGAAGRQFHRHELSRRRAGRQARRAVEGMAAGDEAHCGLARPQHPGEEIERRATEEVAKKLGMELSYFPFITRSFLPGAPPPGDQGDLDKIFRAIVPTVATRWSFFRIPPCSR